MVVFRCFRAGATTAVMRWGFTGSGGGSPATVMGETALVKVVHWEERAKTVRRSGMKRAAGMHPEAVGGPARGEMAPSGARTVSADWCGSCGLEKVHES